MREFLPVSDRMQHMRQLVRDRCIKYDSDVALIMTKSDQKYGPMVPYLKHAKIVRDVLEQKTVRVEDFEMLVCNKAATFCGSGTIPNWDGGFNAIHGVDTGRWTLRDDGYYHNPDDAEVPMAIKKEEYEIYKKEIVPYWADKTYAAIAQTTFNLASFEEVRRVGGSPCGDQLPLIVMPAGHSTPGYQNIMHKGFGAIRQEAQDWLDAHDHCLMGEDTDKWMFYTGVVEVTSGIINMINRYGTACEEKAATCADPARKQELLEMAEGLHRIATEPPQHFREACNLILLYAMVVSSIEGIIDISSMGRFDYNTWPYLKKDLEDGTLTIEQAQEIVDCFVLKVNGFYGGGEDAQAQIIGIGNTYMHTTLGGVDKYTGEDATNEVTYLTMASMARMKLHDPTISLRVNKNTPDELWDYAIQVNREVGGLPLFQNDEEIIPALMRENGFTLEDARDYAIIGCQEITGQGTDYACANGVIPPNTNLHYSALLTMALNNGTNPFTKEQSSLHTGYLYEMTDIEQVKKAWYDMSLYTLETVMSMNNLCEYVIQTYTPYFTLSISMEGCMESGKDVTWGGAKYNEYGSTATGLATVADSLSTIQWACFDKKICTTRELYDACMANWKGYEQLQQRLLNEAPHFGNGDPEADKMMDYVTGAYYDMCQHIHSKRAKTFHAGLYGASDHVAQGYVTWATPDGRENPNPIADGASPAQGRDHNGPTAVLNSANCYDHSKFLCGMALNMRIHPSALSREDGRDKLRDMTKEYMDEGGMEVQYNVVSTDDMRAAQLEPEKYRDLVVRIAGYSAYFVDLSRDQQNDLIARTENNL